MGTAENQRGDLGFRRSSGRRRDRELSAVNLRFGVLSYRRSPQCGGILCVFSWCEWPPERFTSRSICSNYSGWFSNGSTSLPLLRQESGGLLGGFLHEKTHLRMRRLQIRLNSLPA